MSIASPDDFLVRFDVRTVGDLVQDSNTRITVPNLETDPNLQAILDDATGEIMVALRRGLRYSTADITALTTSDLAWLKRICCDIAFAMLLRRRPLERFEELSRRQDEIAGEALARLASGEDLFDLPAQKGASVPTITGPSVAQLNTFNSLPTRCRSGGPYPAYQLPLNR